MRLVQIVCDWSMCQNLNTWSVFLDESGSDEAECHAKVASGRRVAGAIRSLVNAKDLQLGCARVLHETFYLFLHMAVRQCYGKRRRGLELGLYRWTTSEVC